MEVKGLELPAYDVRGLKAHGLNYATSYTGADHNRGYAFQEVFGISSTPLSSKISTDLLSAPTKSTDMNYIATWWIFLYKLRNFKKILYP